jgi:predicted nucleic acid-binding protein
MSAVRAVLDACVLVNASLRDTLLRLASKEVYRPCWSDDIIEELVRTLQQKLRKTPSQTTHLIERMRHHFDGAWVSGYGSLTPKMTNDVKDRHVAACAVQAGARLIVTFNVRHFPAAALEPWLVEAQHPDDFLVNTYRQHSQMLVDVLQEQARAIRWDLPSLLAAQRNGMPKFAQLVADNLLIELPRVRS